MAASITGVFTIIDRASGPMRKMEKQALQTMAAIEAVGKAQDKQAKGSGNSGRKLEQQERALKNIERSAKGASREVSGFEKSMKKTDNSSSQFVNKLGKIAKTFAGLRAILLVTKFSAMAIGVTALIQAVGVLGGGLAALVPQVTATAGALAALPAAVGAAVQGMVALKLALGGVGEALKAGIAQQQTAATAAYDFAQQQRQAAQAVASAEHGLTIAQRGQMEAQRQLTMARRDAKRELIDLSLAAQGSVLGEQRAALSLREAQRALRQGQASGAVGLQMQNLRLSVREARLGLTQSKVDRARASADQTRADRLGVHGSDRVRQARFGVSDANYAAADAARQLADAERSAAHQTALGTSENQKYQQSLKQLSPEARTFVKQLVGLQPVFKDVRAAAGRELFPQLTVGLARALKLLPTVKSGLQDAGRVIGKQTAGLAGDLTTPGRINDIGSIIDQQNGILDRYGRGLRNVVSALIDLMVAAQPFTNWLAATVEGWSQSIRLTAAFGRATGSTAAYLDRAKSALQQFFRIAGNVWEVLKGLGRAATPLGHRLWDGIERTTKAWGGYLDSVKGSQAATDWFNKLYTPIHEIWLLTVELAKAWARITVDPAFITGVHALRESVPYVSRLLSSLSGLGPSAAAFLTQVIRLLSNLPFSSVQLLLDTLTKLLEVINLLLEKVPGLSFVLSGLITAAAVSRLIKYVTGVSLLAKAWEAVKVAALAATGAEAMGALGAAGGAGGGGLLARGAAGGAAVFGGPPAWFALAAGAGAYGIAHTGVGHSLLDFAKNPVRHHGTPLGGMVGANDAAFQSQHGNNAISMRVINQLRGMRSVTDGSVRDILKRLDKLPVGARNRTSKALIEMSTQMEKLGYLPEGATDRLRDKILKHLDNLSVGAKHRIEKMFRAIQGALVAGLTLISPTLGGIAKVLQKLVPGVEKKTGRKGKDLLGAILDLGATDPTRPGLGSQLGLTGPPTLTTHRDIKNFQRAQHLTPDGIVGPQTRRAARAQNVRIVEETNKKIVDSHRRTRKAVGTEQDNTRKEINDSNTATQHDVSTSTKRQHDIVVGNAQDARREVGTAWNGLMSDTLKALTGMGLSRSQARRVLSGETASARASARHTGSSVQAALAGGGFAQGGRIPGSGLQDTVPVNGVAAPGELIANRHTERRVDGMLSHFNTSLGKEVGGEARPHSAPVASTYRDGMRTGSRARKVGGGGGANFGPHPNNVTPGIKSLIALMQSKFPLSVSSTTDHGTMTTNGNVSDHVSGHAVDLSADVDTMHQAAAWVMSSGLFRKLKQGIHNPNLSINAGEVVPSSFWGPVTWGQHLNHLHLALAGGLDTQGIHGGGGVSALLGGAVPGVKTPKTKLRGAPGAMAQQAMTALAMVMNGRIGAQSAGGAGGGYDPSGRGVLTANQVAKLAESVGLPGVTFAQIARGESGYNPHAVGHDPGGTQGLGLWQITTGFNDDIIARFGGREAMFDPLTNARAAKAIYDRQGIKAWYGTRYLTNPNLHYQGAFATGGRVPDWGGWHRRGGSFNVNRPTMIGVGESGMENVKITPKGKSVAGVRPATIQVHIDKIVYHDDGDIQKVIEKELSRVAENLNLGAGSDEDA